MADQTPHGYDKEYWESRWQSGRNDGCPSMDGSPANPHLIREVSDLVPGTALEAGCGAGAEALWLAAQGWDVTAADISGEALARAAARAQAAGLVDRVAWVEADLGAWEPGRQFDLVTTHYAHAAMPQLQFYDRIAGWVAPGGTLLVVGHLHTEGAAGHEHGAGHHHVPHAEASVTAASVTARLDDAVWQVVTADERPRRLAGPAGNEVTLHDVVVRAVRRSSS